MADYSGVNLYDYAVSGAVCSNKITPRYFPPIHSDFPSVLQYEVPAFIADSQLQLPSLSLSSDETIPFLDIPPTETVYSIWIGTNDLGVDAFLTDSQAANRTISDYVDCVYEALDNLYAQGGRYFVLMNNAPLQLAPLYALPAAGGVGANSYWPDKGGNLTEISDRMKEQVTLANDVFKYRTPYEVLVAQRYPDGEIAVMDVYGLVRSSFLVTPCLHVFSFKVEPC